LAERLAVIDHGKVIAEGTSRDLKASVGSNALHVRLSHAEDRDKARAVVTKTLGDGLLPDTEPASITVKVGDVAQASLVLAALSKGGVGVREFSLANPSLDDVFFSLTGRPAEEHKEGAE
jgi:ABC-2 type transport system ATP-binding protein